MKNNGLENFQKSPIYSMDDFFDKKVNIVTIVSIFYALFGMKSMLEHKKLSFVHSAEKLKKEITEYLNYISNIFADMIYEYAFLACYGELRYIKDRIECNNANVVPKYGIITNGRKEYFHYIKRAYNYSKKSIIECAKIMFGGFEWDRSFGGYGWWRVCKVFQYYETMPPYVFIDYCVDIEHNTGSFLNKSCDIFSSDLTGMENLLDFKRRCRSHFDFLQKYYTKFDSRTLNFAIRFCTLFYGYVNQANKNCSILESPFNIPIYWVKYNGDNISYLLREMIKHRYRCYPLNNNAEIFKLSLFEPNKFRGENLAKEIVLVERRYNKSYFSYEFVRQITLFDYFFDPKQYPVIKNSIEKQMEYIRKIEKEDYFSKDSNRRDDD